MSYPSANAVGQAVPTVVVVGDVITSFSLPFQPKEPESDLSGVYTLIGSPAEELGPPNPPPGNDEPLRLKAWRPLAFPFRFEMVESGDLYRIDFVRSGQYLAYLVWLPKPDVPPPVPSFVPGAIYRFFPNGYQNDRREKFFPSSLTREELEVMMAEAGTWPITSKKKLSRNHAGLVVWDIAAMLRP